MASGTHFKSAITAESGFYVGNKETSTQAINTSGGLLQEGTAVAADLTGASPITYTLSESVSLTEINAGKTILAAVAGRTITVVDFTIIAVGGAATAATAVTLSDTASSPVVITTIAVAALTEGNLVKPYTATHVTNGAAGIGASLTAAKGITIEKTGSAMTTATSFTAIISYTIA